MANEQNLKLINGEKMAREYQKKSVESRNKNKLERLSFRIAIESLLEKEFTDKNGNTVTGTEAIAAKVFEQAMKGNIKAFETIRSTVGQDPVQKIAMAEVDQNIIDEIERIVIENES